MILRIHRTITLQHVMVSNTAPPVVTKYAYVFLEVQCVSRTRNNSHHRRAGGWYVIWIQLLFYFIFYFILFFIYAIFLCFGFLCMLKSGLQYVIWAEKHNQAEIKKIKK